MNERAQRQVGGGRFITLEGPDGAGKSIHAERLATALRARGLTVTLVREPGGTALGEAIRRILLDRGLVHAPAADALLFNAARAQLVAEVVRPALGRGEVVVCDRFADSTLAYQGHGSGMDLEALRVVDAAAAEERVAADVLVAVGDLLPASEPIPAAGRKLG